ncbi:hypothetical protein SBA2_260068 [Acidobacteriia bacterium SbA2]|nr:hypothetical protein SBA2_260068 [Acidobacteriia bacterium SbA2]
MFYPAMPITYLARVQKHFYEEKQAGLEANIFGCNLAFSSCFPTELFSTGREPGKYLISSCLL